MNAMILIIYVQFILLMGPAMVITALLIKDIKRENFHDRRARAEQRLARLHGIAHPRESKQAA